MNCYVTVQQLRFNFNVFFVVNRNTGSGSGTQQEKSHSPSLSVSSLSASESTGASPSSADTQKPTVECSSSVSVATSELPAISVATSLSSVDAVEPFKFDTLSQSQPNADDNDLFYDKKKDAQDIVSALQGSFDFLQDSEIDEDSM